MSNKRWTENNGRYELIFTKFYEDEVVATLYKDRENDWVCNSDTLKWNEEYLGIYHFEFEPIDDIGVVKMVVEDILLRHYLDESKYYEELARQFEEE